MDLLGRIVRREPLVASGQSGSSLERGWLEDGSVVVLKHCRVDQDWIMQATNDHDRIAVLWDEGIFDQVPAVVHHAILDVQRVARGTVVVMEDVSTSLFSNGEQIQQGHNHALEALTKMHEAFMSSRLPPLCPLVSLYTFLSPQVCSRFAGSYEVPRLALEGWSRFHDIVPVDVSVFIEEIHSQPSTLADALSLRESTLVHGDPKMANLGVAPDGRLVVLDWGTLTTFGPPAIDYAWYLAINQTAIGLSHERLLADVRAYLAPVDEDALKLALLGALVQLGWEKALGATDDDPVIRQREIDGMSWWISRARDAIESLYA